jgi:hypothetical protein
MAKMTAEQKRQLAELQAIADAPDDNDVEIYVRDERGRETRLTGSYAQRWLHNLGLIEDESESESGTEDESESESESESGTEDQATRKNPADKNGAKQPPRWFR